MSIMRVKYFAFQVVLIASLTLKVGAQDYTLVNLNSSLGINAVNGGFGPAGVTSWVVDGVNQLNFQSFYYRTTGGQELPLDSINPTPFVNFTTSHIDVTYSNANLSVTLTYDLFGNQDGSQKSGLGYQGQIVNKQASPLEFHLFQYSDYNLGGTSGAQSVAMLKNGIGKYRQAGQTYGAMWMTNLVDLTPVSPFVEAGSYSSTLLSLTDAALTTFNNASTNVGPADVTYAFEWDFNLAAGSSRSFSGSFTMEVPEPSSFSMLMLGVFGLARFYSRANHSKIER